jgi:hypothetical protein
VGCEYNDGKDTSYWVKLNPKNFKDIPCCFGAYYDLSLAKSATWIVTEEDVATNRSTGFVEVGSKIRQYILQNQIKTHNWKNNATDYGTGFFKNEKNEVMGVHYVAGSHRRWSNNSFKEIENIIYANYN